MPFFVNIWVIDKTYKLYCFTLSFYLKNCQVFLGHPVNTKFYLTKVLKDNSCDAKYE